VSSNEYHTSASARNQTKTPLTERELRIQQQVCGSSKKSILLAVCPRAVFRGFACAVPRADASVGAVETVSACLWQAAIAYTGEGHVMACVAS
jgi:hypothetical protein